MSDGGCGGASKSMGLRAENDRGTLIERHKKSCHSESSFDEESE
jgi:hypothetical protein